MKAIAALAAMPLLLGIDPLRHALESRMLLHMLVEFPMLLIGGVAAGLLLPARWQWVLQRVDEQGLTSVTLLLSLSALWMVPAALDAALLDPVLGAFKFIGWWCCGLLLAQGMRRQPAALQIFVIGNLSWMSLTAGLLYQTAESRLCVNYLFDDQIWAGRGLVGLGLLLLMGLLTVGRYGPLPSRFATRVE